MSAQTVTLRRRPTPRARPPRGRPPRTPRQLDSTFAALADPTRRAIVAKLAKGPRSVGELAAPFDISLPAVTKHLDVLQEAGLIHRRREGRMQICRLLGNPIRDAAIWMAQYHEFWTGQLAALDEYLQSPQSD